MSRHMILSSRLHVPPSRAHWARALSVESVESLESRTLLNGASVLGTHLSGYAAIVEPLAMRRAGHAANAVVTPAAASTSALGSAHAAATLHPSHSATAAITRVAASTSASTHIPATAKATTTTTPVATTSATTTSSPGVSGVKGLSPQQMQALQKLGAEVDAAATPPQRQALQRLGQLVLPSLPPSVQTQVKSSTPSQQELDLQGLGILALQVLASVQSTTPTSTATTPSIPTFQEWQQQQQQQMSTTSPSSSSNPFTQAFLNDLKRQPPPGSIEYDVLHGIAFWPTALQNVNGTMKPTIPDLPSWLPGINWGAPNPGYPFAGWNPVNNNYGG